MAQTPATGRLRSGHARVPDREISTSAAIALAQAGVRSQDDDRDRLTAGCRFAGTLRPGDAYWFTGRSIGDDGKYMFMQVHRVIVVWGPRLDTTSDIFGRDLIRFWIWDPATGSEGSVTFGPFGQVRVDLDSQYWVPAPGTLDPAAEAALPHHPKCECGPCRPDLTACHHPDCQCPACQPGTWAPAPETPDPAAAAPRRSGSTEGSPATAAGERRKDRYRARR